MLTPLSTIDEFVTLGSLSWDRQRHLSNKICLLLQVCIYSLNLLYCRCGRPAYLRSKHSLEQLHGGPLLGVLQEEAVETAVEAIGSGAESAAYHIQV